MATDRQGGLGPTPVIFTPDNEPYLGRTLLYHFDQLIAAVMEHNARIAPQTHRRLLTDRQRMAGQVISQAINIALSIRELIRQGYLFGGIVLLRALAERAAILLYLHLFPAEIAKWSRGWNCGDAPPLSKMFGAIQKKWEYEPGMRGKELTAAMNSVIHGKPDSAYANLVELGDGRVGLAPSKILSRPDLCDGLCADVIPWLAVILSMMSAYFQSDDPAHSSGDTGPAGCP